MEKTNPLPRSLNAPPPRRRRKAAAAWLLAALSVSFLLTPAPARAQGGPRALMFSTENLPSGDGTTTEPSARRARFLRINAPALIAGDSPLHQTAPADLNLDSSRLELNLFNDIFLTAAFENTVYRNGTNFIAVGVIDGWAQSQIILVAEGEVVAATIDVPGLGVYQVRYYGSGLHKVIELDKARVPACGPIKKAPAKIKPLKVNKKKTKPVVGTEPGPFVEVSSPPLADAGFHPSSIPPILADPITNTIVDVMVAYTTAARTGAGGVIGMNTTIDLAIAEANTAFANSLVPITLNLVFRGEVTYTETGNAGTDLSRLQSPTDGHMDAIHTWRNQYGADLVCLFTETMASYAGLGYVMQTVSTNFSSYSFSVVRRVYATGTYTFAHELGHNMGCVHDRQNSSSAGAYPYSYGHRFVGSDSATYRTVMAYAPGTRIPYFSNPNVTYLGTATGVAIGATNAAHNTASLSNAAPTIAAFRSPVVIQSFASTSNSVYETNATFTLNVTRLSVTNVTATVDYATADGTALAGLDYIATNGTLSFAAGETNKTVTVALLDDATRESTETFTLALSGPSVGTLNLSNSTAYLLDDDASYVSFALTALTVAENTNTIAVEVFRTGVTNTAVTVNYFTTNGTATTAAGDYIATNGLLSFAAGETSKTFSVTVLNDLVAENLEAFSVRLRTPTNTALASSNLTLTVTINTNDSAVLRFSSSTNSVAEGDGSIVLTVWRTGTTNNAVTVDFATTNLTATAGADYTATNNTLSFAAGETNKSFTVVIGDDNTQEVTERFRAALSNPIDATISIPTNLVSILDDDGSTVAFTAATNSVSETNGTLTLTVIRAGATNTAVTLDFATTNLSATAGADYAATNGLFTFAPGVTTNTLVLTITDDHTQETNETFRILLSNATNTTISLGTNVVTLLDDDASSVAFTVSTLSVAEETNNVTFTVVRTGATNTAATVNYATIAGTATAGADYRTTNGILSFAAGVTTNTFAVTVINDTLSESNQVFNVRLSSATNTSLGTSNVVVTILTNDSAVFTLSATATNTESAGTLTITVARTGTTNNAVTVDFATTNVTATAGSDYSATNATLSFAAGETNKTFTLAITEDDTQETNETFRIVLSNPTDARISLATNVLTISDNDGSTVSFTTNVISTAETNATVTLTAVRSGATNTTVTVEFATTNFSATAGSDYTATNGTLTFAPAETTNIITLLITDNQSQETNETFQVRLSAATNTTIGLGTNTITITDNDVAGVTFTTAAMSVAENTNSVIITVERTGATNTVVAVRFAATNGTARAPGDFVLTNGVLAFGLGETSKTFAVTILDDGLAETNETVLLRLTNPTNTSLAISTLVLTITTNDSAYLAFSVATNTVSETNGTLTFTVARSGTTNNAVTVAFTTTNVTATAGTDYTATNATLSFAAGETNKTFTTDITDNATQENTESFRAILSSPTDATITLGTNVVNITDNDGSTVALTTNAVTVSETNGTLTLLILRSGATNTSVTVDFTTTNITATGGSDYGATNGTFTFAPGVTTNTLAIDITDNLSQESTETFQLRLSNATNTTLGTATNTVTITDEDASSVAFTFATISVAENTNSITLTVVRTGATNTAATVNFATTNGTATAAAGDFRATNGVLSFAPGVTTNTFAVTVLNDLVAELSETFSVRLLNVTNCTLGASNVVVTILTNDSAILSFSVATNSISETNGTLTLTVARSGTTNNAVTVDFTSTNVTATAGSDYTTTNATLSFAAGETNKTFTVPITNDDTQESVENFRLVLSNPSDATLGLGTNLVVITDDDVSAVNLTTNAVTVAETNGTVTLQALRSGATNTTVSVNFTTTNVTAAAGSDYMATNGLFVFAPGVTTNTITLNITDDFLQENTEQFRFVLNNATNTTIGTGTNTLTITDDDVAAVNFTFTTISVAENTNLIAVTVLRTGTTNTAVSVNYATTNGTATLAQDYMATNGTLSFVAGETNKSFNVVIRNDLVAELSESFSVRLRNPTNISLGASSNLVVTILTNDSAILSFSVATNTVSETNGTLTLTVARSGTTNNAVTVDFTSTNVTATAGSDYTATNATLSFAAGETNKTFTVPITNNDTQESTETFRLVLSNPIDATISVGTNLVTITDDDGSTINLTTNAVTLAETNTSLVITAIRSGATNTAVTVDYTTTNATASAGSDYTAASGTFTFAPGVTTNTVTLTLADDATQEGNETFSIRLSNASNTSIGTGTNTITITDDDAGSVAFTTNAISVAENTNNVTLTVVRTGATNTAVTVNYATIAGTALAASDYRATNGILSFAPGVTTNTLTVTVINDLVAEVSESFSVRLSSATNISLGASNLVVTILTNDSAILSFSVATNTVSETNGTLTLTVARSGTTNNAVTVDFTSTNVTALAGSDYTATNATLSFAAGETNKTFTVPITNNDTQESTETFRLVLSNPIDARINIGTNLVTIVDDDGSTVYLTTNVVALAETNTSLVITALRSGATNTAVTVDYATTNATASAGSDYTAASGTFTFAPGVTTNTVTLTLADDATQEGNESFSIRLSNASNTSIGTGTNTITITDDDAGSVAFTTNAISVAENTNNVTLTVVRTGATNTTVTVNYATIAGTALAASDYRATNGILSFAPGVTTNTLTVTVINDLVAEVSESFSVRLSSATNISLGASNLVVTILTNDSAILSFSVATNTVSETNGTLTLTVARSGTTNNAVTVDFTSTNVTALAGSDYTATNATLSFAAGETNKTFTVDITDNATQESTETFRLVLSNPIDATISVGTNLVTITDNDGSTISFTTNAVALAETNTSLVITAIRSGATNTAVTVDYTTTNATASAGSDYTAAGATWTFAPGVTTNTVTLTLADDATQEGDETFRILLSNASNTSIGTGTNTITITDDDAGSVAFTTNAISVAENTNNVTLTVVRTGATNTTVTVNYATIAGTALAASDYRATNGILSFAPGVTTNTITVTITNDLIAEVSEAFNVRLSSQTNVSLGVSNLVVTILTNDSAILSFSTATNAISETNGTLTITVARSGTTNNAVTVDFLSTNVTATAGSDYTATNATLSFAAGETNKTFTVPITNDDTQESTETFRVFLSNPVDGILGTGTNVVVVSDDDGSTINLTTNALTLAETNTSLVITAIRSGATNTAVTVDYTTTNATASAGSDYTAAGATWTFAPGVTTNTVTLTLADDATQEGSETFSVRLSNASNTSIGTGTNTITITDDDEGVVSFTTNSIAVAENTNSVTLTVVRSGATNTTVSVNFTNLGSSTATAGSDFVATNGLLVFAPGVTTNTFSVTVINDGLAEVSEYINMRLQNATNCSLGTNSLIITVLTNDSAYLSWSTATTNLAETGGSLTLTLNRTGTTNNAVTVAFTTTNVTASVGVDYTLTNGTLSFAAGETNKTITVAVADDDLQEADETFRVVLSAPTDATIVLGTNTVSITDDDGSVVTLTTNAVTLAETNTSVTLTVIRSGATNTAVAVDFTTTNVTASSGSDYTATNGTLSFAPGVTTNTVTITLADDLTYEGDETFRFVLSGLTNATLATGTNTLTITDNDIAYLGFTAATSSASELDSSVIVTVERTGSTNTTVSVAYHTTNVTATAGDDYTATNGVLVFAPGETNKSITVEVLFDADIESAETFRLRLVSFTNAASATDTNLTITLIDAFGGGFAPASAPPVAIHAVTLAGPDQVRVQVTGPAGAPFVIETTTDFKAWVPAATNVLSGPTFEWLTPIDRSVPARYFRVVRPK